MKLKFLAFLFAILAFGFPEALAAGFDPNAIFPAWGGGGRVNGVIGSNGGSLQTGSGKLALYYVPRVINFLITITSVGVFIMFVMSGLRFIYAGGDEEELKKAKTFFQYGIIGLIFVVISYSLMKAVYYIIA